jgi:hypothetical protein
MPPLRGKPHGTAGSVTQWRVDDGGDSNAMAGVTMVTKND